MYPVLRRASASYTALFNRNCKRAYSSPQAKATSFSRSNNYESAVLRGADRVLESGRVNFAIGRGERTSPAGFALRKGEVFGWNALLEQYPQRIASATCLDNATLLKVNGKETLQILQSDAAAGFAVMRRLASLINRYLAEPGAK